MAHKPGHSGFSYWNGEEDKKPKKKSVQKRVSDASKKKIAKANEKRRKARAAGTKAAKSKKRATQAKGVYKYIVAFS